MVKNRILTNASWIIGCRIVQSVLGMLVGIFTARYLGPSNYGLINYAASITTFITPITYLGFNATLVMEIVDNPGEEGKILGTSLVFSLVSSILCIAGIFTFVTFANAGETDTIIVCILYSILLVFRAFEMIQYWFQSKLLSKYTSIVMFAAYVIVSCYKIFLLATNKEIYWFAISNALDYGIIAIATLIMYFKFGTQKLSFSFELGKRILSKSKYYILSGLMINFYGSVGRVLLKLLVNANETGIYAAAATSATMTGFIFTAIIDSSRPSIFEGKKISIEVFESRIKLLYGILIYLTLLQGISMTLLAKPIIYILYGKQYLLSSNVLQIITWETVFTCMSSVRNMWLLSEGKQKYVLVINMSGAILNLLLNLILIPGFGAIGCASASIITQIFTNFILAFIIKPIRKNNYIILQSLNPKNIINFISQHIKQQ